MPTIPDFKASDEDTYRVTVLDRDGTWRPLLVGFRDFAAATRFVTDAGIADRFEGYAVEVKSSTWLLAWSCDKSGTEIGLGMAGGAR